MRNNRQGPIHDPGTELVEVLQRTQTDPALLAQIVRLVQLSLNLRERNYSGRVELNVGDGLINSVKHEEWVDWRRREIPVSEG